MLSCLFLAAMWSPAGERVDLFAALCVMFSSGFVTFPYGTQGQVLYLIVSIPDLCLILYFQCVQATASITISSFKSSNKGVYVVLYYYDELLYCTVCEKPPWCRG